LRLLNIAEPEVLLGFRSAGGVFLDASTFCSHEDFRIRADGEEKEIQSPGGDAGGLVLATPEITLPESLDHKIFTIVSEEASPEVHVVDIAYQWLNYVNGPSNGACIFLGKKAAKESAKQIPIPLDTDVVPVIALTSKDIQPDVRLVAQDNAIKVTEENRLATIKKHPWLFRWLKEFSSNASEQCGPGEFMPDTWLLPIQGTVVSGGKQRQHWMVTSGCDWLSWTLVITNEDETVSFIRRDGPLRSYDYWPTKIWTVDLDGDGALEFLVKAQYYEGSSYMLLRLINDGKTGYRLTEITGTAYEGF
jgi:hypothetical protein